MTEAAYSVKTMVEEKRCDRRREGQKPLRTEDTAAGTGNKARTLDSGDCRDGSNRWKVKDAVSGKKEKMAGSEGSRNSRPKG